MEFLKPKSKLINSNGIYRKVWFNPIILKNKIKCQVKAEFKSELDHSIPEGWEKCKDYSTDIINKKTGKIKSLNDFKIYNYNNFRLKNLRIEIYGGDVSREYQNSIDLELETIYSRRGPSAYPRRNSFVYFIESGDYYFWKDRYIKLKSFTYYRHDEYKIILTKGQTELISSQIKILISIDKTIQDIKE